MTIASIFMPPIEPQKTAFFKYKLRGIANIWHFSN